MSKFLGFDIISSISKRSFLKILSLLSIGLLTQFKSRGAGSNFIFKSDRESLEKDLKTWDFIELHRTGTEGDQQTAAWLATEIEKCGLSPEFDPVRFTKRTPGRCEVTNGRVSAGGLPLFDGGSTSSSGITGEFGSLDDTKMIAITRYGISPLDSATKNLTESRQENGHAAIVAIADGEYSTPGLAVLNAESYKEPYGPPVLQVASQEAKWLLALDKNERLTVYAELIDEESEALNVQTKVIGRNTSLKPIVVMTPKSGWWTCTSERGGGITIWLNAIRHLSKNTPNRSVIFTANTGHELSHLGLDHFLKQNPSLVEQAYCWVHLGANFAADRGRILWQASSQNYIQQGLKKLKALGLMGIESWPVSSRPLGEARNIHDGGGQFISLLGSNPLFHHPNDRWPHSVDMSKLEKLNSFMINMISDLANKD